MSRLGSTRLELTGFGDWGAVGVRGGVEDRGGVGFFVLLDHLVDEQAAGGSGDCANQDGVLALGHRADGGSYAGSGSDGCGGSVDRVFRLAVSVLPCGRPGRGCSSDWRFAARVA